MHPVLFRLFGLDVPSYGVALAASFAIGILMARHRALRRGLHGERILDVSLVILVASLVGSRALWLATHPGALTSWTSVFGIGSDTTRPGIAGLSMTGGLVLAVVSALVFLRWRRLPVLAYADVLAPSVALGESITRLGCFANGCCFGRVCEAPWCVRFPEGSLAAMALPGSAVHPTQLYASALALATFLVLLAAARASARPGRVLFLFLLLEGAARLLLDTLRHHDATELVHLAGVALPVSSLFAQVLALAGVAGIARSARAAPGLRADHSQ